MLSLRSIFPLIVIPLLSSTLAAAPQCCVPDVTTYCTAGTTVHGCVPSIGSTGMPSALNATGFQISVDNVPGQRNGLVFYGFYQLVTPWAPGSFSFKCIANPIARTTSLASGGNAGACDGRLSLDFNTWMSNNGGALGSPFVSGQVFHAQGWFRDPGAPKQTNLSNALRFVLDGCFDAPAGMVAISPGSFMMGSGEPIGAHPYYNNASEQPVHQVTLTRCFWMAKYEVTQAQYTSVMGVNPSHFQGASLPVEMVSWDQARTFCEALNAQTPNRPVGYEYRLPTEAEWEYACRAGTTTEFHTGIDLLCGQAQFGLTQHTAPPSSCNVIGTSPVGSFSSNAWGLHDMHGNVREWCLDRWEAYSADSQVDPLVTGPPSPPPQLRNIRGGSWDLPSQFLRSAFRAHYFQNHGDYGTGIRVVLAPIATP